MARKAFKLSHMRGDPLIHTGCTMQSVKSKPYSHLIGRVPSPNNPTVVKEDSGEKVNLLIQDLWQKGTDSIHGMQVVNNDLLYYLKRHT